MTDILHLLNIRSSASKLYEALTTSEGVQNWWTREAFLDNFVGGSGEFGFSAYGAGRITRVLIVSLVPSQRVEWRVTDSFRSEWIGTSISFELRQNKNEIQLHFAHRGFRTTEDNFALFNTGWAYYLVCLKRFLELGMGTPSPNLDFLEMFVPSPQKAMAGAARQVCSAR